MSRQRPARRFADSVRTVQRPAFAEPVPHFLGWRGSVSAESGRSVMLAGFSVVVHGVFLALAVFVVRPMHRSDAIPQTIELTFEAQGFSAPASLPETPGDLPPLAAPALVAAQPVQEAPPAAARSVPEQAEAPVATAAVDSEPMPSSTDQLSDAAPDRARPALPMQAAVPREPPAPARRPAPRPQPVQRPVPQNRGSLPVRPDQSGSLPASSSIPQAASPAAQAAPATAPGPGSGAWQGALSAWVQSRRRYPDEARRQGTEGTVAVRFTVARDGQVVDAQVVKGSGSELLDQATLAIFRGARAPYFPPDMVQQQISITVAVRYRLGE